MVLSGGTVSTENRVGLITSHHTNNSTTRNHRVLSSTTPTRKIVMHTTNLNLKQDHHISNNFRRLQLQQLQNNQNMTNASVNGI